MAAPTLPDLAQRFYDSLPERWTNQDPDYDYPVAWLCQAMALGMSKVWEIVRDTDDRPGWATLLDIDTVPDEGLRHLAQFRGVDIPTGLDAVSARARIRAAGGIQRGGIDSITNVAKQFLTGTQTVLVDEAFQGNPYSLRIRTFENESPVKTASVYAALRAEVPAHIQLVYSVVPGMSYDELKATNVTYDALKTLGGTYDDLRKRQT